MQTKFSFLALFTLAAFACTKLDRFSDANAITNFQVTAHSPEEIILDNVKIEGDTVFIPILYGKYDFPLNIKAEVKTSPEINKIAGLDFSKELTLEDINTKLKFYVVAQSGATRAYYIRTREVPLDENNYIFGKVAYKDVTPDDAILSTVTHPDTDESRLELLGAGLEYPVTLTPELNILPSSRFDKIWPEGEEQSASTYENGETAMTFEDSNTTYCLRVLSESGLARVWRVSLKNCALLDETSPVPPTHPVFVNPRTLSTKSESGSPEIFETLVDCQQGSIQIVTRKPSPDQPLLFTFQIPANDLIDLVDVKTDNVLTFESLEDVKVFYILDPYDKVAKKWTVSLTQYKSNQARVLSFHYKYEAQNIRSVIIGSTTKASIVMDTSEVRIYPASKQIILVYTGFQNDNYANNPWWKCTLKDMSIKLDEGATCTLPTTIVWAATDKNQANSLVGEPRTFDVVAEDGTVSTWSISLVNKTAVPNTECLINSITINKVIPHYTTFEDNAAEVDNGNYKIIIFLKNDDSSYPLQIFPAYNLSAYTSILSQSNGTQPLYFENAASVEHVTIQSQDGVTVRDYTVELIPPAKSVDADILRVDLQIPTEFSMDHEPTYDTPNGVITLHIVSDDADFPLKIPYNGIVTSENATASLPARGNFLFNQSTDRVPIAVRAQNGSTKMWYIQLDYRPQFYNGKLDAWKDSNTPSPKKIVKNNVPQEIAYWATANNSFGKGTSREQVGVNDDGTADYCAVMKTISILGNLAAGSLFNGTFDSGNILGGISDPVSLTNFGIPFKPTGKIKGLLVDVWYHPGTVDKDWGSVGMNLVRYNGNPDNYMYHGDDPSTGLPHTGNTAVLAAVGEMRFGTGAAVTSRGEPAMVVSDSQWKNDVFIPVDGSVSFNYISVVFSSSCYGDYLVGVSGSTLKVNNIRIVYE